MNDDERRRLESYLSLARDFVGGLIGGPDFRARFTEQFKHDTILYEPRIGELLMRIFDEAECYEPDAALLEQLQESDPELYIDETRLRGHLRPVVQELAGLLSRP